MFLAQGLTRATSRPEPDEVVTPVTLSLREALAQIRSGVICDAKSIIGVLLPGEYSKAHGDAGTRQVAGEEGLAMARLAARRELV